VKVRVRTCRTRGLLGEHRMRCGATYISPGGAIPQFVQTSCLWDALVALEHAGIPWRGQYLTHTRRQHPEFFCAEPTARLTLKQGTVIFCAVAVRGLKSAAIHIAASLQVASLPRACHNQGDQDVARAVRSALLLPKPSATLL